MWFLVPVLLEWAGLGLHLFMCWGNGDDMSARKSIQSFCKAGSKRAEVVTHLVFVRPKGVWTLSTLKSSLYGRQTSRPVTSGRRSKAAGIAAGFALGLDLSSRRGVPVG